MPTDLERLFDDASDGPSSPIDPDELWAAGRRRRWIRRAGAAGGAAVLVVAVALVGIELTDPGTPEIAPLGQETAAPADTEDTADAEAERQAEREEAQRRLEAERQRLEEERSAREEEARLAAEEELAAVQEEAEREAEREAAAATPDAALVADPCRPHQGRDMDAFLDVAGPVAGQRVGSSFDLVGCSNVPEATVRYRLVDGGGVVVDTFTTATCGTGCVGEFRESVAVPAGSGTLTLEVFWDSPKDGSEQDKLTIALDRS